MKITLVNGTYKARWSYANADGFFIISYPFNMDNFDCCSYIEKKLKNVSTEKNIKENENNIEFTSIQRANYSGNGIDVISKKEVTFPKKIVVLAYTKENDRIALWKQDDEKNSGEIQQFIKYKIIFKKGCLWFKRPKALLRIFSYESFHEDMLYYTVSRNKVRYPINENMLDKDLIIRVKNENQVELKVTEKYKKYYKCSME